MTPDEYADSIGRSLEDGDLAAAGKLLFEFPLAPFHVRVKIVMSRRYESDMRRQYGRSSVRPPSEQRLPRGRGVSPQFFVLGEVSPGSPAMRAQRDSRVKRLSSLPDGYVTYPIEQAKAADELMAERLEAKSVTWDNVVSSAPGDLPRPKDGTRMGAILEDARLKFVQESIDNDPAFAIEYGRRPQTATQNYANLLAKTRSDATARGAELRRFEIYQEGYVATGNAGEARMIGLGYGVDFYSAIRFFEEADQLDFGARAGKVAWGDDGVPSIWGCLLFPTLEEAQESYG